MGLNYKKRIKVAPGVHINVGKKSIGVSVGGKHSGASINSRTGTTVHASAPGTGLSYRKNLGTEAHASTQNSNRVYSSAATAAPSEVLEEPTYLADDIVRSLNQNAFMAYSESVLDYCKQITSNTDQETFQRAQSALHTVSAEMKRRGMDTPAAKPAKENPLKKLTPEQKAKNRKLWMISIAISAIGGIVSQSVGADVFMVIFGLILIFSVIAFVKTK